MSDDDFYTRPILSVKDVELSVSYYCEKLGFERGWEFDKVIAQVGRNGLDIILDADSVIPRASTPSVISMSIGDLEALHRELEVAARTSPPLLSRWTGRKASVSSTSKTRTATCSYFGVTSRPMKYPEIESGFSPLPTGRDAIENRPRHPDSHCRRRRPLRTGYSLTIPRTAPRTPAAPRESDRRG